MFSSLFEKNISQVMQISGFLIHLIVLPMNFLDVYDSPIETAKFDSINQLSMIQ
jgi:hypothetical protein